MVEENNLYFADAQWIFVKDIPKNVCNTYFEYETEFCVDSAENIKLFISASTLYSVYVNDRFVDCGQYADYEDYQVYDELDISRFVSTGKNILNFILDLTKYGTAYWGMPDVFPEENLKCRR